jgi:hypothetical protein
MKFFIYNCVDEVTPKPTDLNVSLMVAGNVSAWHHGANPCRAHHVAARLHLRHAWLNTHPSHQNRALSIASCLNFHALNPHVGQPT